MESALMQVILAAFISFSFSLLFQIRRNLLGWTTFGGIVNWGSYLLFMELFDGGIFMPTLLASVVSATYAELMARFKKTPAIIFLIPTLIPSIPGRSLYYTVSSVVSSDKNAIRFYGNQTILLVLAIAAGISTIWAITLTIQKFIYYKIRKD